MAKNRELKRRYETPVVLDLGALARGIGADCTPGSSAEGTDRGCQKGTSASCHVFPPTACCRSGTTPVSVPSAPSLSGEGQGFDDGSGSGDSGSGEGSGFRTP